MIRKILPNLLLFVAFSTFQLAAEAGQLEFQQDHNTRSHHCHLNRNESRRAAYGKLSASSAISTLAITNPQSAIPPLTGWQPFPVDTFSTFLNTSSPNPASATILVPNAGTYQLNALLTLAYPAPSAGPDDLTNYVIGVFVNNVLQNDSIGSFHISTEAGGENPGLLFSANLSDLVTLPENSTVQFVVAAGLGAGDPAIMDVVSANATIVRVGN